MGQLPLILKTNSDKQNWKPPPLPGSPSATPMQSASPPPPPMPIISPAFGMIPNLNMNINVNPGLHMMPGNVMQGFPQEFNMQGVHPVQQLPAFIPPNFGHAGGNPFQQNWRRRHR